MSKKIYIAGKVTGLSTESVLKKFAIAQSEIEDLNFTAINPITVVNDWQCEWHTAMKRCIKALMDCDGIYILPCSNESEGAMLERNLANTLKIKQFSDLKSLQHYAWNN